MTSTAAATELPGPPVISEAPVEPSPVGPEQPEPSVSDPARRERSMSESALSEPTSTVAAGVVRDRLLQTLRSIWGSTLVRAARAQSLTAPGGLLVAVALLAPGVVIDLATDATQGLPTTLSFLLAAAIPPLLVRKRALATPAVVPPVLFVGALVVLAAGSGQNASNRQVVLDAGTTLALSAPVLFTGSLLALVLVLGRLAWGLVPRR